MKILESGIDLPEVKNLDPQKFLDFIDPIRVSAQESLDLIKRAEMGQFLTPPAVARTMSGMFTHFSETIHLLDPGAGAGTLTAAFIAQAVQQIPKPKKIAVAAFEIDSNLAQRLKKTLSICQAFCAEYSVDFEFEIHQTDFIASSVEFLLGQGSFFDTEAPNYNYAILNPPYKKINSESRTKRLLKSVGIETTNLYSAFTWITMKLLAQDGEFVAILPRSFCNGTYFRPFRISLLKSMVTNRIHIYEARDRAFQEGDVLQENIILHAIKSNVTPKDVVISSSDNPFDENIIKREIQYNQLVHPDDPELFIRIVPDGMGQLISTQVNNMPCTLAELGLTISTGRVVDFRSRHLLRSEPDKEIIPLIYPMNLREGYIHWPLTNAKKSAYMAASPDSERLVVPAQNYVLVKRFSSKEEKRRVYAALYQPGHFPVKKIGIENHLNYYHRRYGGISLELAKGLTAYLNSTLVDLCFRQFSGHTQVNASDLRNLRYPTEKQLESLGKRIGDTFPNQDEIDRLVSEEFLMSNMPDQTNIDDPILAKKKIREALNILQLLGVPRAQQNDRSALTLLALVDIKASSDWNDAKVNVLGITEMMTFFREYYGIEYAPNTRETVRRQTIHQFIQLGLVILNPDDSTRPINSPKTKYVIEPKAFDLVQSYNSMNWEGNLRSYLKQATASGSLQMRERAMPMIPVTLPDGAQLYLSAGGQNQLIKKIVEEFCPRYLLDGKIIYIGDAIGKISENEIRYFDQLGIKIDKHGKMPDLVVELQSKKWLIIIEAVTSHGPINVNRHNELKSLFNNATYGLVFVTAFESRKAMNKYLGEISWETEVWVAESPSHLIHFNGERFLGPYDGQK